jgi:hypothetical protein
MILTINLPSLLRGLRALAGAFRLDSRPPALLLLPPPLLLLLLLLPLLLLRLRWLLPLLLFLNLGRLACLECSTHANGACLCVIRARTCRRQRRRLASVASFQFAPAPLAQISAISAIAMIHQRVAPRESCAPLASHLAGQPPPDYHLARSAAAAWPCTAAGSRPLLIGRSLGISRVLVQ